MAVTDKFCTYDSHADGSQALPGGSGLWQVVSPYGDRLGAVTTPHLIGSRAMRIFHKPGDAPIPSGYRAEHSVGADAGVLNDGDTAWYATAFYLPDASNAFGRGDPGWSPGSTWTILWQIHHKGSTGSPPIAFCADSVWGSQSARLWFDVRSSPSGGASTFNLCQVANPIPLGVWCKMLFRVKMSSSGAGELEVWFATGANPLAMVFNRTGMTNCYTGSDSTGNYEKHGIYTGDSSIGRVVYTQGWVRSATRATAETWLTGTVPPPDPPAPVPVTVSPSQVTLAPSGTAQFTASDGAFVPVPVAWSVNGASGGNATVGFITAGGLYTAPAVPTVSPVTVAATPVSASFLPTSVAVYITPPDVPPPDPPPPVVRVPTNNRPSICARTRLWLRSSYRRGR